MIKTKGKMFYLALAIIFFIVLLIPMFQNVSMGSSIVFYGSQNKLFTSAYMPILFMAMIEWWLITLYIQSLVFDAKKQDATKFDLSS